MTDGDEIDERMTMGQVRRDEDDRDDDDDQG